MSEHQFEVKKEYRTRNGRRCVIVAHDPDLGMIWKVQRDDGVWFVTSDEWTAECHRPVPPERTVDRWHYVNSRGLVCDSLGSGEGVLCRWTIGSDGRPAYAVRLDDAGEPMYDVTRRPADE